MEEIVEKQPVVVVLGHIDSGKTSLLMAIKDFGVLEKESGGITQHLGAYEIEYSGKKITFIDTPGHEAFSQMRSRGAKVADLAILVLDTTKGVQEQTKEAISLIKQVKIPTIVALNKIDRIDSQVKKTELELEKYGIVTERRGGEVPAVEVSAKTKQGIEDLLEMIVLVSQIQNLKANLNQKAKGVVIESFLDPKKGPLATIIVEDGVLKEGDFFVTESSSGKIKRIENFLGQRIEKVYPGGVGIIFGFPEPLMVGEKLEVVDEIKEIKREKKQFLPEEEKEEVKDKKILPILLKSDCQGSLEATKEVLMRLPNDKVKIKILAQGIGNFNENDIYLAREKKAFLVGFRVDLTKTAKILLKREGLKFFNFEVIYDLIEGIRKLMEKVLEPEIIRIDLGKGKVLVIFFTQGSRQIIGVRILEGKVERGAKIEVIRGEEKIGQGKIINLQKERKDIVFAGKGEEVGILYEGNVKIKEGDEVLFFKEERKKVEI